MPKTPQLVKVDAVQYTHKLGSENGRPFHAKAPSGIFYGYGVEHADKEG